MRQPTILDVLRAVTKAAAEHRGIRAWWYAPKKASLEVVIEPWPGGDPDCAAVATTLARMLGVTAVSVRIHDLPRDEGLYRLFRSHSP